MKNKEENIIKNQTNIPQTEINGIINIQENSENSLNNTKEINVSENEYIYQKENINIKINIGNENNNSIFIFNKNEENDKKTNSDNSSSSSLAKQNQHKFKSLSYDKKSKLNKDISFEKIKTPKKTRKGLINIYKKMDINNNNDSNKDIIFCEENENTKIITNAKVRKLSISSENNNNLNYINKDYSPTRIDYVLNLKINNNFDNAINEIKLMSEKYIYKNACNKKEIKDLLLKNNNLIENNFQYQHHNFNRVSLDSIEELYEEENNSKTKSKKTNSELNSYFISEKNNSPNSCKSINKFKINTPNSNTNYSNLKNMFNSTTCLSNKYNLHKNNIFDISSDESENRNYDNNKLINYIDNSIEEQNNYENNIFLRPLDTFINYNEYENTNSFMNESDINKLFSSPNKKLINIIDNNNSYITNNNYVLYNRKINNSAIHNRFNKYILNDETNFNDSNNSIFRKGINNKDFYNKTYIKKSLSKDMNSFNKINNLKKLISPENLNKYYSTTFNNVINNNKTKSNIDCIQILIKTFIKDKFIIKKNENIEFNESIDIINNIKNENGIKCFNINTPYIKRSLNNLNTLSIGNVDKKRKNLIILNSENSKINSNKKEEYNDISLSTTADKKNNNISNGRINDSKIKNKNKNLNLQKNINKCKIDNLKTKNIGEIPRIKNIYFDNSKSRNRLNKNNFSFLNKSQSLTNLENNSNPENKINKQLFNSLDKNYLSIEENTINNENNINNKNNKLYISKESYEELIKELLTKTNDIKNKFFTDINDSKSDNNLIYNDKTVDNIYIKEIDNNIIEFEEKLKLLKNNYLCLLIKKHFLKKKSDKEKIIKEINIINKRELFNKEYLKVINNIKEKINVGNNMKNIYLDKVINILEKYKNISKYDIKYTKKIFLEKNGISPDDLDIKTNNKKQNINNNKFFEGLFSNNLNTKKIITSTTVIIPFLYGISYLEKKIILKKIMNYQMLKTNNL